MARRSRSVPTRAYRTDTGQDWLDDNSKELSDKAEKRGKKTVKQSVQADREFRKFPHRSEVVADSNGIQIRRWEPCKRLRKLGVRFFAIDTRSALAYGELVITGQYKLTKYGSWKQVA